MMTIQSSAALEKRPELKKCNSVCPDNYEPVCGGNKEAANEKPKSFGSLCVMNSYNCQNNASMYYTFLNM